MADNTQTNTNQESSRLGGVKTPEGKAVSRYNAQTHGILRIALTDYEKEFYSNILDDLLLENEPQGIIEEILIERIAVNYMKLFRVQKAEAEFMKSKLNPLITKTEGGYSFEVDELLAGKTVVIKEGYYPTITSDNVQTIMDIYGRYETTIENRLFRALHELERAQKIRRGEKVLQPLAVDINQVGSFGEKGVEDE